jgi:hypothetical protein
VGHVQQLDGAIAGHADVRQRRDPAPLIRSSPRRATPTAAR